VAVYACDICGCENYQEIADASYKPLTHCMSKKCIENKVSGKLTFLPGHSKFRSYQELKIQETSDQLKQGSIPKSITVHLKGNNVKQASPGDIILLQAVILPTRRLGYRFQHCLAFDSHLEAFKVLREKKKYVEMAITEEQIMRVQYERSTTLEERLFNKLAKSIAPEIFGLDYVKKALLLLLTGGVTK
jgi:DNA replication licensing factor MCM7